MKNKYLEVEAIPFAGQGQGSPFKVRPLYSRLDYNKASQKFNKRVFSIIARSIFVLLFLFIPLNSSGQITVREEVIIKTNEERKAQQINGLKVNPLLEKAAFEKAQHMLNQDYFDHIAPNGAEPWDFIIKEGYDYKFAGENLAINYSSSDEVLAAWMASETHRNNILDKDFNEIGVAVVKGELEGKNTLLIVQILGAEDK